MQWESYKAVKLVAFSCKGRAFRPSCAGRRMAETAALPAEREDQRKDVAECSGFSLHAGVLAKGSERDKLEKLARYVSRPPLASGRGRDTQCRGE